MIWLIGGTSDSREFIEKFPFSSILMATTATEYGKHLLDQYSIESQAGKLTIEEMEKFVLREKIKLILDLSHPYAKEISKNAISLSKKLGIPYLRYERSEIFQKSPLVSHEFSDTSKSFSTPESIAEYIENLNGNILVTLGSNSLESFSKNKNLKNIFFRVLPLPDVLEKCRNLGILPNNIIALLGPFSENMNRSLIDEYEIKYLVSKRSGKSGGEYEKIEACRKTGTTLIYLDKPAMTYEESYDNMDSFIERVISMILSPKGENI